jgi:diguanylate cyclase (GGDEF)-like protein
VRPLVARWRRGLKWVEHRLNERYSTTGCLFISLVALPFVLVIWCMDLYALLDPAAGRFYHPQLLRFVALQETLSLLLYLGVILYCLPRWRSAEPRPWLAYPLITFVLVASTNLAILYGHKDTPMALVFLASFVLTRAWFPLRVLLPGVVLSALMIVAAEILIHRDVIPYAPLLARPVITGEPMTWWWNIWMRVLYDMAVAFFSLAMFFIFGIMERRHRVLEELTRTDTLTGLLNRGTFMRVLEEEFAKQARHRRAACVMMCDIDHFKRVNDTWGHAAGDAVLVRVGHLLRESVRQPIDVPARFGGEEFVVLLPETGLEAARVVAERIAAMLREAVFEADGQRFSVTISIGITEVDDGDPERALREADASLYQAKAAGRDRIVAAVAPPGTLLAAEQ